MLRSHTFSLLAARTVGCGILAAAILRFGPSACGAATLAERLEKARVVREFNTEGARVWRVVTAKDLVGFVLHRKDSSLAVVYDLNGVQRFRFGIPEGLGEYRQIQGLALSGDGSTVIVDELVDIEYFHSHVFGIDGKERFFVGAEQGLSLSPHGKRFCRRIEALSDPLVIYDSAGNVTGSIPCPNNLGDWNCRFVDDDRLLVADGETVKLIDARATTVWIVSLGAQRDPGAPVILPSPTHSLVAVYDGSYLLVLTLDGQELWRTTYTPPEFLCAVAIDEATSHMALQFRRNQEGFVRVVSLRTGAPLSAPAALDPSTIMTFGTTDRVLLSRDLLSILGPTNSMLRRLVGGREAWTLFMQFDDTTHSFSTPTTVPDLYFKAADWAYLRVTARRAQLVELPHE
jgi:hypothetical protein